MKKKVAKKEQVTKKDLAQMLGSFGNKLGSKVDILDSRITKIESYIKEGFTSLDNKMEHVDARISNQIEDLGRRVDDFADNKVSRLTYKELERRVFVLESKVLPKAKK